MRMMTVMMMMMATVPINSYRCQRRGGVGQDGDGLTAAGKPFQIKNRVIARTRIEMLL